MSDTREAIKKQFMKEYRDKDFAAITVKGLCAATPVARTTFYSYYNNTDEVREEIENELIGGLQKVADTQANGNYAEMDFVAFLDELQMYIKEHWSEFYIFLIHQPNQRFITKWKECVKANFKKRYPKKTKIKNYGLISEIIGSSTIGAYTYWMMHPEEVTTEEMKQLITQALTAVTQIL